VAADGDTVAVSVMLAPATTDVAEETSEVVVVVAPVEADVDVVVLPDDPHPANARLIAERAIHAALRTDLEFNFIMPPPEERACFKPRASHSEWFFTRFARSANIDFLAV